MRPVDRELQVVRPDPVAVRVGVRERTAEQHLVGAEADARHQRAGLEGGLLDLGEEVLRVPVQRHRADLDQRVVAVRPDLGEVERVDPVGLRVLVGHRLDRQRPAREVALRDRVVEVATVEVRVLAGDPRGVVVGEALDALVAVEVVLDPVLLAGLVDPQVGVRAVAVHVAVGLRDAAVTHQVGHLVRRLRVEAPEVPLHVVVAQPVAAAALLRADEVRELHRVADEEDRGVVADEVVVALGRVELQREAARVAPGVGRALLAGHGREAREHLGLHAGLEQRRPWCTPRRPRWSRTHRTHPSPWRARCAPARARG